LGFIPFDLEYDALEISKATTPREFLKEHPELKGKRFLQSSDAHYPEDIARAYTRFEMDELSWKGFTEALLHLRYD
ncbi:MAG: histidinol-phosphatase, partial [Proteiniphilum sp.]|jgi:PHP family Zn ribbon phosphoesterase|nr:histidinol-phosphatase [Proteiniphilum sp.]